MAKDPATLWYWNDWIGGTMTMTRQAKGAYLDLLTAQFNSGHLTEPQIKTLLGQDQGLWVTVLREKFSVDGDGKYYNKRLDDEIKKRKAHSQKQKENVGKRWNKSGNTTVHTKHIPLENEIEDEDEIEIKEKGVIGGKELSDLDAGKTVEFCVITLHRNYDLPRVRELWQAFLIQNEKEFYPKESERVRHFRNWIKTQPYEPKIKTLKPYIDADDIKNKSA